MELRALIVDDEYPAREEVRYQLERYENIKIVGEAATVDAALALIKAIDYELVFLDINFPSSNGINLGLEIKKLQNPPQIIYITAYEEYAVKAFDVNAIDYILKPVDPDKLRRAIERVEHALDVNAKIPRETQSDSGSAAGAATAQNASVVSRLSGEKNGNIKLIDINEIYFAYSEDSYIFIRTFDDVMITRYTMAGLEDKLAEKNFFRAHRCYLINLDKIKEISPMFKGACMLIMSDKSNSRIQVSRRKAGELKELFDL